jgi:hypothetical protein
MLTYADVCGAGARLVELYLDDACIFAGEIACAPGNLIDAESQAEILLFSQVARTLSALFFFDVSLFWHGNLTLLAFFFNFLPFFFLVKSYSCVSRRMSVLSRHSRRASMSSASRRRCSRQLCSYEYLKRLLPYEAATNPLRGCY